MTASEWLTATDPTSMFDYLGRNASDRKHLLLSLACCQRLSHVLQADELQHALRVADRWVEGTRNHDERKVARRAAHAVTPNQQLSGAAWAVQQLLAKGLLVANDILFRLAEARLQEVYISAHEAGILGQPAVRERAERARLDEQTAQCCLIRDIFANPFHCVIAESCWFTSTVVGVAREIYDSRDFSAMPILADALQDAGCGNADVLTHCRSDDPHTRGCWLIDLLTGRE